MKIRYFQYCRIFGIITENAELRDENSILKFFWVNFLENVFGIFFWNFFLEFHFLSENVALIGVPTFGYFRYFGITKNISNTVLNIENT